MLGPPGRQQLGAVGEQRRQMLEEIPHLALGATAELRRIDQDHVVGFAAAHFARRELRGIVDDPADLCGIEFGRGLVLAPPRHGFLRGVDVGHFGAGLGGEQGSGTGVAEEIEDARRLALHLGEFTDHPLPVRPLLGKEAQVPEAGELAEHGDAVDVNGPGFGHRLVDAPAALVVVLVGR